jgi:hypothetical protein
MAIEHNSDQKRNSHTMIPSKKSSNDAHSFVEALANRNPPPTYEVPLHSLPIYDNKYDWSESNRVWKAIPILIRHAEEAWPELVKHIDDKRYCMTVKMFDDSICNWNVGNFCRDIMGRSLSEAYYRNLRPLTKIVYIKLRWPEIAHDPKRLKLWLKERSKKKLYELQIEMCEWAIPVVEKDDFRDPRITIKMKQDWIKAIQAEIKSLRESKKAVPFPGYGPEEIMPYSPDDAESNHKHKHD